MPNYIHLCLTILISIEDESVEISTSTTALIRHQSFVDYASAGLTKNALMRADSFRYICILYYMILRILYSI